MKKYILLLLIAFYIASCNDINEGQMKPWTPGPLEEFTVTPINGGATITYTIPNDPDILYVMAEYKRNGVLFTEKSSVHNNSLTIEGFHGERNVQASLYKVNKHEQKSEPVVVEFEPLESVIDIVQKSLEIRPDFGGIIAVWENPLATELGIRLMLEDSLDVDQLTTKTMIYSSLKDGHHAFRGFESVETLFAIAIEDKWGNVSDTISLVTTPYYEKLIEKPFVDIRSIIPYDNRSNHSSAYLLEKIWDNIVNSSYNGYRSLAGSSGLSFTFDLQQVVKLSRIIHHGYHINNPYHYGNIHDMEIWGTSKLDYDKLSDLPYWLDEESVRQGAIDGIPRDYEMPERTFKDDWVYLGYHAIPRYDLTGENQAKLDIAANGATYNIDPDAGPVRYIRVFNRASGYAYPASPGIQYTIGELTFYGDNTVPQE